MRNLSLLILIIVFALASSGALLAEQTLVIELDTPKTQPQAAPEKDLSLSRQATGANAQASTTQGTSQAKAAGTQSDSKEVAIGRVGVVISDKADIRRVPVNGAVLFTCPKDTYLAILGENGDWYGTLMVDNSTAWIAKKHVTLLDYQVIGQAPQGNGSKIVNTALKYLGIQYKWGGYSMNGLDCSGFVKAVFASHGVTLPRVSRDQALVGTSVSWSNLQPGDRLYFACKGRHVDHTGIYMGNGHFIHSSVGRGGVAVDSIHKPFWMNSLVVARRS